MPFMYNPTDEAILNPTSPRRDSSIHLHASLKPREVRNAPQHLADFQRELERQGVDLDWPRMHTSRSYYSHHNVELKDAADFYFGEAWRLK